MRPLLLVLKIVVGAAAILVAVDLTRHVVGSASTPRPAVEPETTGEVLGGSVDVDSVRAARSAVLARINRPDSYLPQMLVDGDSMLRRWQDRAARPLPVYLASSDVPGYSPELREAVRAAFLRWERVATIPVRFAFVPDSASAEVTVTWIHRFDIRRAGQADITWGRGGWIVRGHLTLATHTANGLRLTPDAVHTVAMHEIGHLLGLGHSDDPRDVMYPSTAVHDLTARDRHTARLLYSVPPGSLKLGG